MTPEPITYVSAVRGLYFRHAVAEQARDRDGQNAVLAILDAAMWPLAFGGIGTAVGFPASVAGIAVSEFTKSKGPSR